MGTDLVVRYPCPRCHGVDRLTCPRCDGSGRVGDRTRAEQVEAFLREEHAVQEALLQVRDPNIEGGEIPAVRCSRCSWVWRPEVVGGRCPNCSSDLTGAQVYEAKANRPVEIMGGPDAVGFPIDAVQSLRSRLSS